MPTWISPGSLICLVVAGFCLWGCTKHEVDVKPVEIKPIHITIDVNVKVDRALDDFFGDLDKAQAGE
jgi:hypothetical protein